MTRRTTTSSNLPWDGIALPTDDLHVLLVADSGAVPAYWGKGSDGRLLFLIKLLGDHKELFLEETVSIQGIDVDLQTDTSPGYQRLVLSLDRQRDVDLFFALCNSLVGDLRLAVDAEEALKIVLSHLRRWKAFLANRNARLLSAEEIRGLFAELTFLQTLLSEGLPQKAAVDAWVGPDRIQQDFVFRGRAVEVKSLFATDPSSVRISSEDQLESIEESLFLVTYRISEPPSPGIGNNLNGLVSNLREEIQDADAQAELERKLASAGYATLVDYDKPTLQVTGTAAYSVEQGFPRLVRSHLPIGIHRLSYQIQLESIVEYRCELAQVIGGPI